MVLVHVASVAVALATGAWLLLTTKGTGPHRVIGWCYVTAIVGTALSSFGIYELRSGLPSIFHAVSVAVLMSLAIGVVAIRRSNNQPLHLFFTAISYLTTILTGVAQFFDRLPLPSDAWNAIVFLQLPAVIGFGLIWRSASRMGPGSPP